MNLPNNLSVLRVVLVPVFVALLVYFSPEKNYFRHLATAVFAFACLTDALDGYIARRLNEKTVFGSYLDPIADKLLLVTGFAALSFLAHLPADMKVPAWVAITVVTRDVLILVGSIVVFLSTGDLRAEPLLTSKATTFVQMVTLLAVLVGCSEVVRQLLFAATAALTVVSGILYIRMGGKLIQS